MAEERHRSGNSGCQEFDANLAAFLDGEENTHVRKHAEQCSSCRSLLSDLELIRSAARDLPLESPSPRVWSNIRASLAQEGFFHEHQSFWRKWIAQVSLVTSAAPVAALAFALILAVILIFRGDVQRNGSLSPAPASVTASASVVPVGLTGVQANLVRTVQEMEENYRTRESLLDPSAKHTYQRGLASLNNSIQECLDSLQKQPNNMLAREYLMHAYAQKAEVLASALEYGGR